MERPLAVLILAASANLYLLGAAPAQTSSTQITSAPLPPPQTSTSQTQASQTSAASATPAQAPSSEPNSSAVSDQFKSGATNLGSGFAQVGEGIKQGAILTWDAVKDGASTTASHFNGTSDSAAPAHQSQ